MGNQIVKFQYTVNGIEFFITFKGVKVIVLTAKLDTADFNEVKRLHHIAQDEALQVQADLRLAA